MKHYRNLLLWLIVLNAFIASAQSIVLRNLSVADGLSQSTINHLLQDSKGYMWIATGDGLNRYDGRKFKHFKYDPSSRNGLPSNMVRRLCEDKTDSRIWIGTDNGIGCFDLRTGRLSKPFASLVDFRETYTSPLFYNEQNLWLCAGNKGIIKLNIQSLELEYLVHGQLSFFSIPNGNSREIIYQKNTEYIYWMNLESGAADSIYWSIEHNHPREAQIYAAGPRDFHLYSSEGSYRLNFESHQILPLPNEWTNDATDVILDHIQDGENNHYIAVAGKGVFVYDKSRLLRHQFVDVFENAQNEIFDLKNVRRFFLDNNGVVWCATDGDGAVLINLGSEKFRPIEWIDNSNGIQRFRSFSRCITEVDGNLWVASYREGISIFEKGTRHVTNILRGDKRFFSINAIEDCGEYVLIGSDAGLFILNKPYAGSSLITISEDVVVKSLVRMNNHFCIATNNGMYKYLPDSNKLLHWDVVEIMNTTSLLKDKSDNLMIGLSCEGMAVVLANGGILRIQLQTSEGIALPNLDIISMIQLNNHYYIATNHGLFILREDFSQAAHFSEQEGLVNSHLYGLLVDSNGMIWLSTNGGISRFNPVTGKFKNFSMADGLQSMEHNRNSYYSTSDGVFYMGGTTGVSRFLPNAFQGSDILPPIRLAGIEVMNDTKINTDSLVNLEFPLRCAYNRNNLQFELAVLDFFRADRYDVEYKLEGWDNVFQSMGSDRFIRYTNLPPGTYSLIARIANEENASKTILLTIIVESPIWRHTWFIAGLVILFLLIIVVVNSLYIRMRNRKAEIALDRVREIEKMRTRISKDIHDEVGAGLTKIALMSEAAKLNSGSKEELTSTLDKLAHVSRTITKGLHEIIWSVNPDEDNSASLFDQINLYAHDFLEDANVELNMQFQDAVKLTITPFMRRNVFLIVKEALNNILKHSKASRVEISLRTTRDKTWLLVISDNGIGFSAHNPSSGHGLRNMNNRAEQCGLDLKLSSEEGNGTSIRLSGRSE